MKYRQVTCYTFMNYTSFPQEEYREGTNAIDSDTKFATNQPNLKSSTL